MKKIIVASLLALGFLVISAAIHNVKAAEFNVDITRDYSLESAETLRVVETHVVRNDSTNLLITKNNQETFQITVVDNDENQLPRTLQSAKLFIDNVASNFEIFEYENYLEIKAQYPRDLKRGESMVFRLEYQNYGLHNKSGALIDIYAPGFAEDFSFVQGQTQLSYHTNVRINKNLSEINFVLPAVYELSEQDTEWIISFDQNELVDKSVWIQLGKVQNYQFHIQQTASPSDDRDTGYFNEYRIILPRDVTEAQIIQKVYFTKIEPKPFQVVEDDENNLIAYFKVPSHVAGVIVVEGYAQVSKRENEINPENSGTIAQYDTNFINKYTKAGAYWEVETLEIKDIANQLQSQELNILNIISANYHYVVGAIDYSQVKKFGINERQGALKTLQGGAAVCMEYSDLFLSISRAQGIPSRAVFGYGYDSKTSNITTEAHQWVQIYLPGIEEWVSVDVTWGENGEVLIGGDLNHFYTHITAVDPNTPSMVERISYGKDVDLVAPDIKVEAVEVIANTSSAMDSQTLLAEYPAQNTETTRGNILDSLLGDIQKVNWQTKSHIFIIGGFLLFGGAILLGIYMLLPNKNSRTV